MSRNVYECLSAHCAIKANASISIHTIDENPKLT